MNSSMLVSKLENVKKYDHRSHAVRCWKVRDGVERCEMVQHCTVGAGFFDVRVS